MVKPKKPQQTSTNSTEQNYSQCYILVEVFFSCKENEGGTKSIPTQGFHISCSLLITIAVGNLSSNTISNFFFLARIAISLTHLNKQNREQRERE